jgi:hypothetical protein
MQNIVVGVVTDIDFSIHQNSSIFSEVLMRGVVGGDVEMIHLHSNPA